MSQTFPCPLSEYENILYFLDRVKPNHVGFYLSFENTEQKDCGLYTVNQTGKILNKSKLYNIGSYRFNRFNCRDDMIMIAHGVSVVTATVVSKSIYGFSKIIAGNYPNQKIAIDAETSGVDNRWLFDSIHGIPKSFQTETIENGKRIFYPVQTKKVNEGESLSQIAKRITGSINNWKILWAMNSHKITDPNKIIEGNYITVPGEIKKWEEIDKSEFANYIDASISIYRTSLLENLIKFLCEDNMFSESEPNICKVPVFSEIGELNSFWMKPIDIHPFLPD